MAAARVKPLARGAQSLGALAPRITKAAYEAHGFPVAALISDWSTIAGAELAPFTRPERLVWPQRRESGRGATLYLCAEGPRALEVQHSVPQLLDRLNTHFVYRAVTQIRIIQAPITRSPARRRTDPPAPLEASPDMDLTDIGDDRLRAALSRLARLVR